MINKLKRLGKDPLYKNSFFIMLTSVVNDGFGFVFWVLAAALYAQEDIGIATAIISAIMLITTIANLGLSFSMIRFFPENDKSRIFNTSVIVTTIFSIILGAVFILCVDVFSPELRLLKTPLNSALFLAFLAVTSISTLIGVAFIAARKAKMYFLQSLFIGSRIIFLLPLVSLGAAGIFSSVGISYVIASLILVVFLVNCGIRPKFAVDRGFIDDTLHFSAGNYFINLFTVAPNYILPIMVLNMLGANAAAYFYMAFMIASLVYMIPTAVSTSLLVEGSHGEALKKSVIKSLYAIFFILTPAILGIYLFGDFVLGLIGGEYAANGFELLKTMAAAGIFVACCNVFCSIKRIQKDIKGLIFLSGMTFALLLTLSYLLMPVFGLVGVGYAWIISNGISTIVIGAIAKKEKWI